MSDGKRPPLKDLINEVADEIDNLIRHNGSNGLYSAETLTKLKRSAQVCRLAAIMVQRVDWFVSGDDGEPEFHDRWDEELAKHERRYREAEQP